MKLEINRNVEEWDLPKEIAENVLAAIEEIEAGNYGRKTEFNLLESGAVERVITDSNGELIQREVLNAAMSARLRTGLSQAKFAKLTGISPRTLQEWEQGRRKPSSAARALLRIAAMRPDVVREVLSTSV